MGVPPNGWFLFGNLPSFDSWMITGGSPSWLRPETSMKSHQLELGSGRLGASPEPRHSMFIFSFTVGVRRITRSFRASKGIGISHGWNLWDLPWEFPWGFRAGILIRNEPGSQSLRIRREWMYSWLEKYGYPMIQWKFQDPKMEVRS